MKKIISLLLAVLMLLGCCGCGDSGAGEDVRGEVIDDTQNATEGTEPMFSLGETSGKTYSNEFLGLRCTVPDGWEFYADEQILELNNIAGDCMDEAVSQQIAAAQIVYDMFAINQEEGSNMNVNLEKVGAVQLLTMDLKTVMENQIEAIRTTYENIGYTDINIEYQKVKVDKQELDGLVITAKIQGIDFYSTIFAFTKYSYIANVTICSQQAEKIDDILDCFKLK